MNPAAFSERAGSSWLRGDVRFALLVHAAEAAGVEDVDEQVADQDDGEPKVASHDEGSEGGLGLQKVHEELFFVV